MNKKKERRKEYHKEFLIPQPSGFIQVMMAAFLTIINPLWPFSLIGLLLFIRNQWARKVIRSISILILAVLCLFIVMFFTGVGEMTINSGTLFGYTIRPMLGGMYVFISNLLIVLLLGSNRTKMWYKNES